MTKSRKLLPLLIVIAGPAFAGALKVEVRAESGEAVEDAVVYAVPEDGAVDAPKPAARMDQYNRMFVPRVLPVQTGTAVHFPNSDNIRHQVYSFSKAKKFQIPLYEGTPPEPIVFDKPGVSSLGCNIHDRMSAYIVVVDTPYFATTKDGIGEIDLPPGKYAVHVWYPGMREGRAVETVEVDDSPSVNLALTAP